MLVQEGDWDDKHGLSGQLSKAKPASVPMVDFYNLEAEPQKAKLNQVGRIDDWDDSGSDGGDDSEEPDDDANFEFDEDDDWGELA